MFEGIEAFQESKPKCELLNKLKEAVANKLPEYNEEFKQDLINSLNVDPKLRPTIFELQNLMNQTII